MLFLWENNGNTGIKGVKPKYGNLGCECYTLVWPLTNHRPWFCGCVLDSQFPLSTALSLLYEAVTRVASGTLSSPPVPRIRNHNYHTEIQQSLLSFTTLLSHLIHSPTSSPSPTSPHPPHQPLSPPLSAAPASPSLWPLLPRPCVAPPTPRVWPYE